MPLGFSLRRLHPSDVVEFECVDADLTAFFRNDSQTYLKELLAVTYAIEFEGTVIAMFSLCNDRLDIHDFDDNHKLLKKAARKIPHPKRGLKHFPAVKIGRLAVRKGLEGKRLGLGRAIVQFIQAFFIFRNKTGCRFLTVDSYPGAIGFYEKMGFKKIDKPTEIETEKCPACDVELPREDPDEIENDHTLMYLDLGVLVGTPSINQLGSIVDSLLTSNSSEFSFGEAPLLNEEASAQTPT